MGGPVYTIYSKAFCYCECVQWRAYPTSSLALSSPVGVQGGRDSPGFGPCSCSVQRHHRSADLTPQDSENLVVHNTGTPLVVCDLLSHCELHYGTHTASRRGCKWAARRAGRRAGSGSVCFVLFLPFCFSLYVVILIPPPSPNMTPTPHTLTHSSRPLAITPHLPTHR